jgi:hypothetical protein
MYPSPVTAFALTDALMGATGAAQPQSASELARTPCIEGSHQIVVGNENYFLSGDGLLMPTKKDQAPPDLRYFNRPQTRK